MKKYRHLVQLLSAAAIFVPCILPAATLVDSITAAAGTTTGSQLSYDGKGLAFTVGQDAHTLDNIVVTLRISPTVSDIVAGVYASTGSTSARPIKPGSAPLVSLNLSTITVAGIQAVTLTPASAFTLEANTTYFLVLYGTEGANNAEWMYDASTPVTSAGFTLPDVAATTGNQAGWFFETSNGGNVNTNPATWTGQTGVYNDMTVNGTLIPEPSAALFAGSMGVICLLRRRR